MRVGDHDLRGIGGDGLAGYRRSTVGFVFQHFGLLETLTALENVELAGTLAGERASRRRARARELLDAVGVGERVGHRPLQLSGGERQRVAIARALVNRPQLVLADEPTGNLDSRSGASIVAMLEELNAAGATIVVITHDHDLAGHFPRRIEILDGRIVADTAHDEERVGEH